MSGRSIGRFFHDLLKLRPGEMRPVFVFFLWCFCQVGAVWSARAVRDALFLHKMREQLPNMYIVTPFSISAIGYMYARVEGRFRRDRLEIGTAATIAVLLLLARLAIGVGVGNWFYYALYITVDVFAAICGMQMWMAVADRYTSRDAKRVFGLIAAGGTFAIVFTGALFAATAKSAGAENLLFLAAALFFGCSTLAWIAKRSSGRQVGKVRARTSTKGPPVKNKDVPGAGHLTLVALVIVTAVLTVTSLDYTYKTTASIALHGDKVAMAQVFGKIAIVSGLLSMIIQFGLTSRLLGRLGVAGTLIILPVFLSFGAMSLIVLPGLAAAVFCNASDRTFRYTLNDAGMQLLYLPVPAQVRTRAKFTLDAFIRPATEACVGVGLLIYGYFATSMGMNDKARLLPIAGAALFFALCWIGNILRLRGRYVRSLRETLRRRRLDFSGEGGRAPLDAARAVRRVLEVDPAGADAEELLHALELARELTREGAGASVAHEAAPLLAHPDARVRAAACAVVGPGDVDALTARLDDKHVGVRAAAVAAICRVAGTDVVAMTRVRALLDDAEPSVRAAAVAGVSLAGDDEARAAAAAALERLANSPSPDARVLAASVLGELGASPLGARLATLLDDKDGRVVQAALAAAARLKRLDLQPALARLLARRGYGRAAANALAAYGPGIERFVAGLLEDERVDAAVRRQLPRILAKVATPEAVRLLVAQLVSSDEALRGRACHALAKARQQNPALAVPRAQVVAACDVELLNAYTALAAAEGLGRPETAANMDGTRAAPPYLPEEPDGAAALISKALRERVDGAVDRIFALLDVLHPEIEVDVVRANLADPDPSRRANAVEVLDSVLDKRLRARVVPLVDDTPRFAKVRAAEGLFALPRGTRDSWVATLLADDNAWMAACAAFYAGLHGVGALADQVDKLRGHSSAVVRETAAQAMTRLRMPGARRQTT